MADIDLTVGQGSEPIYSAADRLLMWEKIIDFSKTGQALAATDTMQLFDLPADVLVIGAKVEVLKPEGAAATADLGLTGGNVDEYIDGADLNAAAGTVVVSGDAATPEPITFQNNGKYLSAAETVSLLANNALSTAVIRVQIVAIDMRSVLPDPTV